MNSALREKVNVSSKVGAGPYEIRSDREKKLLLKAINGKAHLEIFNEVLDDIILPKHRRAKGEKDYDFELPLQTHGSPRHQVEPSAPAPPRRLCSGHSRLQTGYVQSAGVLRAAATSTGGSRRSPRAADPLPNLAHWLAAVCFGRSVIRSSDRAAPRRCSSTPGRSRAPQAQRAATGLSSSAEGRAASSSNPAIGVSAPLEPLMLPVQDAACGPILPHVVVRADRGKRGMDAAAHHPAEHVRQLDGARRLGGRARRIPAARDTAADIAKRSAPMSTARKRRA